MIISKSHFALIPKCNKLIFWVKYLVCQNCENIICSRHPNYEFKYFSINTPGPGGFYTSYNYPDGESITKSKFLCSFCRKSNK